MVPDDYLINEKATVIEALKLLDNLPLIQTVFVTNSLGQIIGSITDGDIRRGFINGLNLESNLKEFVYQDFSYLVKGENNFVKLKELRRRRLRAVPLLNDKGELLRIYDFTKIKSILPIDAVIMAGGEGKRLRPLTENTPKPLLKIGNKEIISYIIDRLYLYGINNQTITINYLGDQIKEFCNGYNHEINFRILEEDSFLGTAGSLSLINGIQNDLVLLMNSDLLTNVDYEDLYKSFQEKDADMMVASTPYQYNLPYAIMDLENDEIKSLKEKPRFTYYANAGIYLFKKTLIEMIPKGTYFDATDLMGEVIKRNKKLVHYPIRSYWLDIGRHEDFEKAQRDIGHIDFD